MSQFYAVKTDTDSNYDDSQHTRDKEEASSDEEQWKEVTELVVNEENIDIEPNVKN